MEAVIPEGDVRRGGGMGSVADSPCAPKKNAENTVQNCGGGGGSMVANHRSGGESSMVVTTLIYMIHKGLFWV